MSVNIMDMVKGAVSKEMMGQLGGLLGQSDPKQTSSVFETAAGSILGGLMKKASSPAGAKDLLGAIQNHDDSILNNLGSIFNGGQVDESVLKSGGGLLDMIFGSGLTGIFDAIAKYVKLDPALVQKLMKLAAPILMGVIGKQVKNKALDAVGLSSLLGDQKSALSNALPASLASSLGLGNLLGGASDAMRNTGAAVSRAGHTASAAASDAASTGGSLLKFLLPLILLGALAWFGYTYFIKPKPGDADNAGKVVVPDTGKMDAASFDLAELQKQFTGVTDGLRNVTAENANEVATRIKDLTGSVENMGLDKLTGTTRTAVSGVIEKFIDTINGAVDRIPDEGISRILKPLVKTLVEKLKSFE